ncbi:MAG: hypothetical protein PHU21_00830 [Elusimicrobia bacterium]|nr:hypothetical protein [Elusimicrobiota bacterium]
MEQDKGLKQMESTMSLLGDHVSVLVSKLESLLGRAHRIRRALTDNPKAQTPDTMFGYDLQNFRRDVRALAVELGGISTVLGNIERGAHGSDSDLIRAQSVLRLAARLQRSASTLQDHSLVAHETIRSAEHKVEAWYLVQEVEALVSLTQPLAGVANKIVIAVSAAPKAAPAAALRPRTPVPMRFVPMRPLVWTEAEPAEG